MAGIFSKEVADECLTRMSVASCPHKEMLQLSCNSTRVKDPIRPSAALQIEGHQLKPGAKHEVFRCRIAMHKDLLVFNEAVSVA